MKGLESQEQDLFYKSITKNTVNFFTQESEATDSKQRNFFTQESEATDSKQKVL